MNKRLAALSLKDVNTDSLSDLNNIDVDCDMPMLERIRSFVLQIKSPYMFRVNDRAVKVVFDKSSTITFEDCVTKAITDIISANP